MKPLMNAMVDMAQLLNTMEEIVLKCKTTLATMELKAIDPDSKSAVDKQIMIFAQKSEDYTDMKTKVDAQALELSGYQRLYSLYNTICQRIDYNIEGNKEFADFEQQVEETVNKMAASI